MSNLRIWYKWVQDGAGWVNTRIAAYDIKPFDSEYVRWLKPGVRPSDSD